MHRRRAFPQRRLPSTFGVGGAEPHAAALEGSATVLHLHGVLPDLRSGPSLIAVGRRSVDADASDQRLFDGLNGRVLDVGCGPGRMVGAEIARELCALGIDVTPTADRRPPTADRRAKCGGVGPDRARPIGL
ncbi:MAG: hypothetical protein LH624_13365 [Cryobacterium sp.]|nr:hypothetical protein [Cryobacterium sp.]